MLTSEPRKNIADNLGGNLKSLLVYGVTWTVLFYIGLLCFEGPPAGTLEEVQGIAIFFGFSLCVGLVYLFLLSVFEWFWRLKPHSTPMHGWRVRSVIASSILYVACAPFLMTANHDFTRLLQLHGFCLALMIVSGFAGARTKVQFLVRRLAEEKTSQ